MLNLPKNGLTKINCKSSCLNVLARLDEQVDVRRYASVGTELIPYILVSFVEPLRKRNDVAGIVVCYRVGGFDLIRFEYYCNIYASWRSSWIVYDICYNYSIMPFIFGFFKIFWVYIIVIFPVCIYP